MAGFEFKVPTTKEEYEEMKKALRQEISMDDLEKIAGGNDDKNKHKKDKEGFLWTCPFCGAQIMTYQFEDGPKHITKCPNNPWK